MREYYITMSDMGYHIFRQKNENGIKKVERLQRNSYTQKKEFARTFYHIDEVLGIFVIVKRRNTISVKRPELAEREEKTSWQQLS